VTSKLASWGLDIHRAGEWTERAFCVRPDVNRDWWCGDRSAMARHLCVSHCPVLEECRNDIPTDPELRQGTVYGGYVYSHTGVLLSTQPSVRSCTWCPGGVRRKDRMDPEEEKE